MTATKIVVVGEAWGEREEEKGRPFVGPSGNLLDGFLNSQGISRSECYLTNVFNFRPKRNPIETSEVVGTKAESLPGFPTLGKGKYVRAEYAGELARLHQEIRNVNPNLVVALGATASWALLRDHRIKKLRGSPHKGITGHKVLPTYHPAAVLREFKLRPIVFSDFGKIRKESEFPDIRRPVREFWLYPTLDDLAAFEPFIYASRELSVDIETWNRQITCIGFAPTTDRALVIPFCWHGSPDGNYWKTFEEEKAAWGYVKKWVEAGIPLVGQNFSYDMGYMWRYYGIRVREPGPSYNLPIVSDTMLRHHAMQPEMEKSLALLSSLYTDEPQHKFMRETQETTLKKED